MSVKKYSVGFMLYLPAFKVALVRKARPAWQMGLLNGIGGHIEENETPLDCMIREFKEETGVLAKEWHLAGILRGTDADYELNIFKAYTSRMLELRNPDSSEPVAWYNFRPGLPQDVIPNLHWLVNYCADTTLTGIFDLGTKGN